MEALIALAIGVLVAAASICCCARGRIPVILGIMMLGYAVNLFLVAMGRLGRGAAPIIQRGRRGVRRSAAAGAGADGHRHRLRHGRLHRRARAARSVSRAGTDHVDGEERPVSAHLVIMPVLLPFMAGILLMLLASAASPLQRALAVAALLLTLALRRGCSSAHHTRYRAQSTGWATGRPPFGIVLVLDRLSALMLVLTAVVALFSLLHACRAGREGRCTIRSSSCSWWA
jgi:multisubunit Na+/H+ antiporter MnhC subunit